MQIFPDKTDLKKILKIILDKKVDFADIFCEETISTTITLEDNKIEKAVSGRDRGIGLRAISGMTCFYGFTEDTSFTALKCAAETLVSTISDSNNKNIVLNLSSIKSKFRTEIKIPPTKEELKNKAGFSKIINDSARSIGKEIVQCSVSYHDYVQNILIVNSDGEITKDKRIYTSLSTQVIAKKDGLVQTIKRGYGGFCGMEIYKKHPPQKIGQEAAQVAIEFLDAKNFKAGEFPVVIAAGWGGVVFHEACGHGLEADFIEKNTSIYTGKIGQQVASPLITLVDDGSIPGRQGSFAFDDEGVPSQKNILIENGILKNYMFDRFTAMKMESKSTGNGRRQSYQHPPQPRMTNTYIYPGKNHPSEIIASIDYGLYAKNFGGGQVDIMSGDFVFSVTEGYLIEKGKITYPVRGASLIGNGPKILQEIDMIGNDLEFDPGIGMCGKGQMVPVSVGQPTIRIPKITVGGMG